MTESVLRFEDVVIPGTPNPLSLEVPDHQAVLITGPEASGVDALPAIALRLRRPARGRVFLFGEPIDALSPRAVLAFRRKVGYLPAGDGLLHNLSLHENVALPLRFGSDLSEHAIQGRLQVMLALLRIADAADRRPAEATEEQRRRAALARALAFDPKLLILADPFDGLTAKTAAELFEISRGGETGEGSRRAVFMTAQFVPERLETRIEYRYRLTSGTLQPVL
jgi:putative ABC transport system ATP-binding protein